MEPVTVIGAGLAGSECAWQLAQRGIPVTLREMKPEKTTPAHVTPYFAELCCSNSLRGAGLENAVGLLKEELRRLDSLILRCADATAVPAGGALAVDREGFARMVTESLLAHPLVTLVPGEVTAIPDGTVVIASGPLTSDPLADANVFEGCMPVEVMARRGEDTLRFGPLKPRGLPDPKTGREPYAVVQLRRDNADGTIYNLVGFQTHLKWGEQKRVFSLIPALHDAQYLRYGVMHRNTYLDSPRLLDRYYRLKSDPRIAFAGQMTGVEGYVESCASGFLAGVELARRLKGQTPIDFPQETAIGALGLYISNETVADFQPMNVNFGIIPPLDHRVKGKRNKNAELSQRSLAILDTVKEEVLSL